MTEPQPEEVATQSVQAHTATTSILANASGSSINGAYHTIAGNQPVTYGNFYTYWQQPEMQVPWETGIINDKIKPQENTPDGSVAIANVDIGIEGYLVAWAVGKDIGNIVATCYIPKSGAGQVVTPFSPSLEVQSMYASSVVLNYALPPGANPNEYGHWVGVFEGSAASHSTPPKFMAPVNDPAAQSAVAVNGMLRRGRNYTAAYFAGGWDPTKPDQRTLACLVGFTT